MAGSRGGCLWRKRGFTRDIFQDVAGSQGIRLRNMSLITSLPRGRVLVAPKKCAFARYPRDMVEIFQTT